MRTSDFIRWVNGEGHGSLPEFFSGVSIDSRNVPEGCLYAALAGTNTDGHRFVEAALDAGASVALVRDDWRQDDDAVRKLPLIRVKDPRTALTAGARAYRHTLNAVVIGVTGSAGKTTTKELAAAFLRAGGTTSATKGNFNNDLGLPLTILSAPQNARFCVWEMGTNHPGEIPALVNLARPHAGIISSIGTAHIEFFKTQDGIAKEKGALFAGLSDGAVKGFAVLSRENDRYEKLRSMCVKDIVEVSLEDESAEFFGRVIDAAGGVMEVVERNGARTVLNTHLSGVHNLSNALLAFAAARKLGVAADACAMALDGFVLPGQRWQIVERGGVTYVNDSYNANPSSMIAALETFVLRPVNGRRVAVLGDMGELGEKAAELHELVGKRVRELPVDHLITVGDLANEHIRGNRKCANVEEAKKVLMDYVRGGDEVLIKASRSMELDKILQ